MFDYAPDVIEDLGKKILSEAAEVIGEKKF